MAPYKLLVTPCELLVTHITHLGEFTGMSTEQQNCGNLSKLHLLASQQIGIAQIFLTIPVPQVKEPLLPPGWATE